MFNLEPSPQTRPRTAWDSHRLFEVLQAYGAVNRRHLSQVLVLVERLSDTLIEVTGGSAVRRAKRVRTRRGGKEEG
jgi:hypothetical protein